MNVGMAVPFGVGDGGAGGIGCGGALAGGTGCPEDRKFALPPESVFFIPSAGVLFSVVAPSDPGAIISASSISIDGASTA